MKVRDDLELPRGVSVIEKPDGRFVVRCSCDWSDWSGSLTVAVLLGFQHAKYNAWCFIHRNLTPVGADPVTSPGPERGSHLDHGEEGDELDA